MKYFRASFSPSCYSDKMRWGRCSNLAYLQIQVSLISNHIYLTIYWKVVLKYFIAWSRKLLKLHTNDTGFFSFRWMCWWCYQYSNKLPVYFSHSHTFYDWCRSACWIIRKTVFHLNICLNHSSRYKQNKIESCDQKLRHWKAVSSKFIQFLYLSVFRERPKCLTWRFCDFFYCNILLLVTLSKIYSHCTEKWYFYYFLGTRVCFVTKSSSISS